MSSLADALLAEMTRVRDQVMPAYQEIGASGAFALTLMRRDLDEAAALWPRATRSRASGCINH